MKIYSNYLLFKGCLVILTLIYQLSAKNTLKIDFTQDYGVRRSVSIPIGSTCDSAFQTDTHSGCKFHRLKSFSSFFCT